MSHRELPRAGTPLTRKDFWTACRSMLRHAQRLEEVFARWLSVEQVWVVSSGRAALCLILRALAERSLRREVIVPAYTCPTVPLAVARAGLQVRLCDVDLITGNLDVQRLAKTVGDETLAVLAVHMHGIPCDMPGILAIAQQQGTFVIEDCAQAAGAMLDGQKVGTFGDAAFFSLGRGKGFAGYEGGIGRIADCDPMKYAPHWTDQGSRIEDCRRKTAETLADALTIAKLVGMALFFHPGLYWMIRALPLGWDNEVYDLNFRIGKIGRFRQGVALSVLGRLDKVVEKRRDKAEYLREQLRGVPGVQLLEPSAESQPSYPWLPLLVEKRDEAVSRLRVRGLGAFWLFTRSLNQYEYLGDIIPRGSYPCAEDMAAHLLTLPTHEYVTRRDMEDMVSVLAEVRC